MSLSSLRLGRLALGLLAFGLMASQANAQFGITFGGGRGVRLGRQDRSYTDWDRRYNPSWNAPAPVPNPAGGLIEIESAADTVLKYSLNASPYEINPGQVHRLRNDRAWVIEFDRGGDLGFATYALTAGRYKFVAGKEGWDLVRSRDPVGRNPLPAQPDNRRNPLPSASASPTPASVPALVTDEDLAVPVGPALRNTPTPVDAIAPTEGPALPTSAEPTPVEPTPVEPTPVASTTRVIPPLTKVKPRRAPATPTPVALPAPTP